jgi:hypothetical protein
MEMGALNVRTKWKHEKTSGLRRSNNMRCYRLYGFNSIEVKVTKIADLCGSLWHALEQTLLPNPAIRTLKLICCTPSYINGSYPTSCTIKVYHLLVRRVLYRFLKLYQFLSWLQYQLIFINL